MTCIRDTYNDIVSKNVARGHHQESAHTMRYRFQVKTPDLLVWNGNVVMSRGEAPFFEILFRRVKHLNPERVLEAGFGLGVSADLIQKILKPRHHEIVEIDSSIYKDLRAFSRKRRGVRGVRGDFWTFKPKHKFDFIFYDGFDYSDEEYTQQDEKQYAADLAERVNALIRPGATLCWPHFGGDKPQQIPGFKLSLYEKLKVPPYLCDDGTYTTKAAIVCWQKARRGCKPR
jgi:predicted O-methyltransferase YrrM